MNNKIISTLLLSILAVVFTIALSFASLELPKLADNLIHQNVDFVNVYTGGGNLQEIKSELFIKHFHLRTIGYISLIIIIILIVVGFVTEKTGYTTLGAVAIFLPVFGHFASTMFFLGGLGFLRLLWLPGLDISFDLMRLGDSVFIPYRIIIDGFNLIGIDLNIILPFLLIGIGLFIFCIGTLIWFNIYFKEKGVAKVWLYKYSRHPQYLGWIIWSYGIMFMPGANMKQSYTISDSLPWLISTLIIIGVAMLEEIKMSKKFGHEYENYRRASYFMIPFPNYFCRTISAPFRVFFNKGYPTKKSEIAIVLAFYFALIISITVALNSSATMTAPGRWIYEDESRNIEELAEAFVSSLARRDKYSLSKSMTEKGLPSIPYFIGFLNHPDFVIREFSADALGKLKPEEAINPLIRALQDENWRVVNSAVISLGQFNSDEAIDALINLLDSKSNNIKNLAAGALARIGNKKALSSVIPLSEEGKIFPSEELIFALSNSKSKRAEKLLIQLMSNDDIKIKQAAVIGARNFYSENIIKALKTAQKDNNWEVRLYAEEILKQINNTNPHK